MYPQAGPEEFPGLYNPKHTQSANPLHRVGKKLSLCVRLVLFVDFLSSLQD